MPEVPPQAGQAVCPCICHMGREPRDVIHSRACCPDWNGRLDGPAGDSLPHIDVRARREERARIAADLERAAEGRRQCTRRLPVDHGARELLADEAACYETAARIAEDPSALLDVLPVWMWTKEERDCDG